jgi:predicted nucleic acid-binding protein
VWTDKASVLRRQSAKGVLSARRANFAIEDLMDLPLTRYPHAALAWRIWDLRHTLTSYDAAYVALAESLECSLVTADRTLASASGVQCDVEVVMPA